ncbi:MAG: hypothetical protein IJ666_02085 [Ruminococcus sp.]|nr:hypothetical protein [Ruminococcus sp.]
MKLNIWSGGWGYDRIARLTDSETEYLKNKFPDINIVSPMNYYLIDSKRKIISSVPFLSLIFGGMYGDDIPVGENLNGFDFFDIFDYKFEPFIFDRN